MLFWQEARHQAGRNESLIRVSQYSSGALQRSEYGLYILQEVKQFLSGPEGTGNPVAYLKEMNVVIVPSIFAPDANDYYMETHD